MNTNNEKTVRGLYKGVAKTNVFLAEIPFMLAFEAVMEYDSGDEDAIIGNYWGVVKYTGGWVYFGSQDEKSVNPSRFTSVPLKYNGLYFDVPAGMDEEISELSSEIAHNNTVNEYAESVVNYWRGTVKIDTVTITEAV